MLTTIKNIRLKVKQTGKLKNLDNVTQEFNTLVKDVNRINDKLKQNLNMVNTSGDNNRDRITALEANPVWHSGSGVPSSDIGKDGDFYLDTATKDIYFKDSGVWA